MNVVVREALWLGLVVVATIGCQHHTSDERSFDEALNQYLRHEHRSAIEQFDRYTSTYPDGGRIREARLLRRLSQCSVNLELQAVKVENIESLDSSVRRYSDGLGSRIKEEWNELLLDIATGYTEAAKDAAVRQDKARLIQVAKAAAAIGNKPTYDPSLTPKGSRWWRVERSINLVLRELDREKQLELTLTQVKAALEKGDAEEAEQIRRDLLRSYPDLINDPRLDNGS